MSRHTHTIRWLLIAGLSVPLLQGCAAVAVGAAAVGVSSATDPRTLGTQLDDQAIEMKANAKLGNDKQLEDYRIRVVSYGKQVLLVGQVDTDAQRARAEEVISDTNGIERIFNQIRLASKAGIATQASDTWISSRVRMKLIADDEVDATDVKVVTENGEVFLLGIVNDSAADRAVEIARNIDGVQKVVKAFSRAR
ncbi:MULTISPECIES: division/outer membrane stress-associated lipid-binding lipoprotein [unclassified Idiomarina]|jgi:osmotically-inducible protein OsmY|uniref:division/outer membrane stress-associated lipid-binding lipoprotein n=1 Tax=unclassified Idiomarina TaxID=2614829 RepID=UPI000C8DD330|nr:MULTISPECIES: division/outer membrane stress-associated lipid-binding lipoprotein [unclassified Idiomarina]MAD52622.1 osmotically-inducible protein OsmY [Idiomarinaceae bacterium]MEC7643884.1 division/outer membrane stress-associated lipid-binding lipoprotein [Pseudomonadota bacterium]NQZ03304.1 divisome-associated lipoprotein YraP [Idiomarina sp.]|tara:strand:- start:4756 stop:5340 length:585 start_codon:yes stop_codon:yes gene_type:complete